MRAIYDVAVVGCGPVGALLANLLGARGLRVVVLERETDIHPLPRAVHFDGEAMRAFQSAGLAEAVQAIARPTSKGMHFVNAHGETLLVRRGIDGEGPQGWVNNWYVHQPQLEQVLRAGLARYANVGLRLGCEVTGLTDDTEAVHLSLSPTLPGEPPTCTARYVVGCDGGRSLVRRTIGATQQDLGLHQPWLVVDLICDPGSPRVRALPDHTVQYCDPARPATAVYVGGARRRWEIMLMPGDEPAGMADPERVWPLLERWIGPADARIERAALYTFHSVIARGWRQGRILLAGDACHQTPPFLGQGLCAGIRDVVNLAWKLALVAQGRAPEMLLDTYESERRPHVAAFIQLAVDLGAIIQTTDSEAAAARDRRFFGGAPKMFDFPLPQLGPGLHAAGAPPPIGQIAPQPRLADGRLLDELIGGRFGVVGTPAFWSAMSDAQRSRWLAAAVLLLEERCDGIEAWLAAHGIHAALLRPDGYCAACSASALAEALYPSYENAVAGRTTRTA